MIKLFENQLRIYDCMQSDCCVRFSGAVVPGAYKGCCMIDPMPHSTIIGGLALPGGLCGNYRDDESRSDRSSKKLSIRI